MASQAYVDAINAFSAAIASTKDHDDIASAKTAFDAAFAGVRAKAKAEVQVAADTAKAANLRVQADAIDTSVQSLAEVHGIAVPKGVADGLVQ